MTKHQQHLFENAWLIQPVTRLIAARHYQGNIYMKTCSRCVLQQGRVVCVSLHCLPSKQALPRQGPKHVWQCLLWSVWTRTILAQTCLSTVIHYNPRAAFTPWSTHAWSFFFPLKAGRFQTLSNTITHQTVVVSVATTTEWSTFSEADDPISTWSNNSITLILRCVTETTPTRDNCWFCEHVNIVVHTL